MRTSHRALHASLDRLAAGIAGSALWCEAVPVDLDRDLARVLVHEDYGHAFPLLLAGALSGRCADPRPDQRAADACSIRRENAVRAELGLGRRTDYVAGYWHWGVAVPARRHHQPTSVIHPSFFAASSSPA